MTNRNNKNASPPRQFNTGNTILATFCVVEHGFTSALSSLWP